MKKKNLKVGAEEEEKRQEEPEPRLTACLFFRNELHRCMRDSKGGLQTSPHCVTCCWGSTLRLPPTSHHICLLLV